MCETVEEAITQLNAEYVVKEKELNERRLEPATTRVQQVVERAGASKRTTPQMEINNHPNLMDTKAMLKEGRYPPLYWWRSGKRLLFRKLMWRIGNCLLLWNTAWQFMPSCFILVQR